jgi:hypothetical protein
VLAGVAIVVGVWRWGVDGSEEAWRARVDLAVPMLSAEGPGWSGEGGAAVRVRLINDVLRRPGWGGAEAEELARVLGAPWPAAGSRGSRDATLDHMAASAVICARFESGAPMTPEARAVLVEALLGELESPVAARRSNAAMILIVSREAESPPVRAALERLLDDADAETAEVVAFQLARYDEQRRAASGGE